MNYCVIDTETTGTPGDSWARVVEIGAVAFVDGGFEIGTFSSLMCPLILDERANRSLARNGIEFEAVAAAPTESSVREKFSLWMQNYSIQRVYAYNQVFDQTMLERSGFYLPWCGCIMQSVRRIVGKTVSLRAAAERFGVPYPDPAHRALVDARCAAEVLHRIVHSPIGTI